MVDYDDLFRQFVSASGTSALFGAELYEALSALTKLGRPVIPAGQVLVLVTKEGNRYGIFETLSAIDMGITNRKAIENYFVAHEPGTFKYLFATSKTIVPAVTLGRCRLPFRHELADYYRRKLV